MTPQQNKHYQRGFGDAFNDRPPDVGYGMKVALYSHTYGTKVQGLYGAGFTAGSIEREKSITETQGAARERLATKAGRLV